MLMSAWKEPENMSCVVAVRGRHREVPVPPPVAGDAAVSLPPALPGVPPARPLGKRASLVQGKKKSGKNGRGPGLAPFISAAHQQWGAQEDSSLCRAAVITAGDRRPGGRRRWDAAIGAAGRGMRHMEGSGRHAQG